MEQDGKNRTMPADITKLKRRAGREQKLFDATLDVLTEAFRMRMPEARERAQRLRDSYLQMAVNLNRQRDFMKARAVRHIGRAERIGKILEVNRNRNLIRARHDATPEILVKPRAQDPIAMLVEKGKLDTAHERAAREIARIYQAVVAALMPRIACLEIGKGPGRGSVADRMPEEIAIWHHDRYLPWTRTLAGKDDVSLPLIIDVAVDGISVNAACQHRRIGYARGVRLIAEALALYAQYRWASPGVDNRLDKTA